MTKPRYVVPGQILLLTRRTHGRTFLLRPDKTTTAVVTYILAAGLKKFGLKLIAGVVMSDHYHLLVVDEEGCYPAFAQWVNSLIARAVNQLRGRDDALWSTAPLMANPIADADAVIDRAAYVLANPVQDAAVRHGRDWPGFRTNPQSCDQKPRRIRRPKAFFGPDSKLPDEIELEVHVPPSHAELGAHAFGAQLSKLVREREAAALEEHDRQGKRPGNAARARRTAWQTRATKPETKGPGSTPHEVIARDEESRSVLQNIIRSFRDFYDITRADWRSGARDREWPAGTWLMRMRHQLQCQPPPAPQW